MLKTVVAVLTVALAGTAGATGWRALRIDGSSQAGFVKSVAELQRKLSPMRREVFSRALQDVWKKASNDAQADHREYTPSEYFRQLDGLTYKEVITFTDPTGDTADRYQAAFYARQGSSGLRPYDSPWPTPQQVGAVHGRSDAGDATARQACGCAFPYPY